MERSQIVFENVDVDKIRPNPSQPRESFERESIQELAESIKQGGVIQPIIIRMNGATYEIIAGERRWRATQIAGLKQIPALIKQVSDNRVLLESLVENLHRLDLTDIERENAVHELWINKEKLGIETQVELARTLGLKPDKISDDIEAWEARHVMGMPLDVSTRTISRTRGLEPKVRKRIVDKVSRSQFRASDVDIIAKVIRKAPESIKRELLRAKPRITPKIAESIVEKLESKEEQEAVLKEIIQHRLTEDEVETRIVDIKRSREKDVSPIVDRQIIIEGQWLVDRIRKPVNNLLSINPDAFDALDKDQKEEIIEQLVKLENTIRLWIIRLKEVKVVDMR